jgi:hypothetical protein
MYGTPADSTSLMGNPVSRGFPERRLGESILLGEDLILAPDIVRLDLRARILPSGYGQSNCNCEFFFQQSLSRRDGACNASPTGSKLFIVWIPRGAASGATKVTLTSFERSVRLRYPFVFKVFFSTQRTGGLPAEASMKTNENHGGREGSP